MMSWEVIPIPETIRTFHWMMRLCRAVMFHQKEIGVEAVDF